MVLLSPEFRCIYSFLPDTVSTVKISPILEHSPPKAAVEVLAPLMPVFYHNFTQQMSKVALLREDEKVFEKIFLPRYAKSLILH